MVNQQLLEIAYNRFRNKNKFNDRDYKVSMDEFIVRMYLNCDPASYGRQFVKKLLRDNGELSYLKDWVDCGDICQHFPRRETLGCGLYDYDLHDYVRYEQAMKTTMEVKISYLTSKNLYTIRNIRPYQNFDFYLLCFIDCNINFTPQFILVNKDVICKNDLITLSAMGGTKKANQNNKQLIYGTVIRRNGVQEKLLQSENKLGGTTYKDLISFFMNNREILEQNYRKGHPITYKIDRYVDEYDFRGNDSDSVKIEVDLV